MCCNNYCLKIDEYVERITLAQAKCAKMSGIEEPNHSEKAFYM